MAECYQFTWGEVHAIELAIRLGQRLMNQIEYAHIEAKDFDLDMDKIGIRIRIPHDRLLTEERNPL
ncbi:hypothetical protein ES703_19476 [subsurface metagenome]